MQSVSFDNNGIIVTPDDPDRQTNVIIRDKSGKSTNVIVEGDLVVKGKLQGHAGPLDLNITSSSDASFQSVTIPNSSDSGRCSIRSAGTNATGVNITSTNISLVAGGSIRLQVGSGSTQVANSNVQFQSGSAICYAPNTFSAATNTLSSTGGAYIICNASSNNVIVRVPTNLAIGQKYKILVTNASTNTVSLVPVNTVTVNYYIAGGITSVVGNAGETNTITLPNNTMFELIGTTTTTYSLIRVNDPGFNQSNDFSVPGNTTLSGTLAVNGSTLLGPGISTAANSMTLGNNYSTYNVQVNGRLQLSGGMTPQIFCTAVNSDYTLNLSNAINRTYSIYNMMNNVPRTLSIVNDLGGANAITRNVLFTVFVWGAEADSNTITLTNGTGGTAATWGTAPHSITTNFSAGSTTGTSFTFTEPGVRKIEFIYYYDATASNCRWIIRQA